MPSERVIVIGAGVLGLATAAELARRERSVTVVDPGGANASSVAAGMIAPALESLIDHARPERAALLLRARDLWPDFAHRHGLMLHRDGADWRGEGASGQLARLRALGFHAQPIEGGLTTPDDWRIDARDALTNLAATAGMACVEARALAVRSEGGTWVVELSDGRALAAGALVIATGAASSLPGLPEAVAARIDAIEPIKGQLTFVRVDPPDRVIRGAGAYVTPHRDGVLIGATMRPGERDLSADVAEADRQVSQGLDLLGRTAGEAGETRVGVRGASPDGLPLAGRAGAEGLYLALAPRRNGWLLGPLVARILADQIEGVAPPGDAAALDPLRFG